MMERRVRTWWVVRERYRRAGWAASVLGGLLGLLPTIATLWSDGPGVLLDPRFLLVSLAMAAAGVLIPAWIVTALWRWQKRRNGVNWS
jgi:hypothetical protein